MLTKMTVSFRLFLYFSIGAALLVTLAIFSIVALQSVNAIAAFEQSAAARTRLAGELADNISEFRVREADYLLATGQRQLSDVRAEMIDRLTSNVALRAAYLPLIRSEEEKRSFATLEQAWGTYAARHAEFMTLAATDRARAAAPYAGALQTDYKIADAATDDLGCYSLERAAAERERAQNITDRALRVLIGVCVLTCGMAFVLLFLLRRQVGRPLSEITRALSTVAAGNFNVQVPGHQRQDEIGTLARARDVFLRTAQRLDQARRDAEEAHRQVEALACHDALTGLPNRRVLSDEMQKALARVGRTGATCAILVIDLDRFKPVNDIHGHSGGDAVLCQLADQLKSVLRKNEILARLGGDEFAVVAEFVAEPDGPMRLATRLIKAANQPISVEGTSIEVRATIGVALSPADGTAPDSLLRAADIAMYRGKREGRGSFRFFEENMELELRARVQLETELRTAITIGEIEPHYQPVVGLADRKLLGFEILARWRHPEKGLLLPAVFIPVVDEAA
jgi:diguanylate cyclase (GGDEF)-like protein